MAMVFLIELILGPTVNGILMTEPIYGQKIAHNGQILMVMAMVTIPQITQHSQTNIPQIQQQPMIQMEIVIQIIGPLSKMVQTVLV